MFSGNAFSTAPFSALAASSQDAVVSGVSASFSLGTVTVQIPLSQDVTGQQVTASIGTVSAEAFVVQNITGISISASLGSAAVEIPLTQVVTGSEIQFSIGDIAIPINGVSAQFYVGIVAAYSWTDIADPTSSWAEIPDQSSAWVPVQTAPAPNWIEV